MSSCLQKSAENWRSYAFWKLTKFVIFRDCGVPLYRKNSSNFFPQIQPIGIFFFTGRYERRIYSQIGDGTCRWVAEPVRIRWYENNPCNLNAILLQNADKFPNPCWRAHDVNMNMDAFDDI